MGVSKPVTSRKCADCLNCENFILSRRVDGIQYALCDFWDMVIIMPESPQYGCQSGYRPMTGRRGPDNKVVGVEA